MEDQKIIMQRIEMLEASVRSFAFTYSEIENLLEKTVEDLRKLGDGMRHTAQRFDNIGIGYRVDPLRNSDSSAQKIADNISRTLASLRRYWYGPEYEEMMKGKLKDERSERKC